MSCLHSSIYKYLLILIKLSKNMYSFKCHYAPDWITMLIDCRVRCIKPFSTLFQLYRGGKAPIHVFLEFFLPLLSTIPITSNWLLSQITIVEAMKSGERGMDCTICSELSALGPLIFILRLIRQCI